MSPDHLSGICSAGSCEWCGCHFRRPSDVLRHRCAAMQEAEDNQNTDPLPYPGYRYAAAPVSGGGLQRRDP